MVPGFGMTGAWGAACRFYESVIQFGIPHACGLFGPTLSKRPSLFWSELLSVKDAIRILRQFLLSYAAFQMGRQKTGFFDAVVLESCHLFSGHG